MNAKTKAVLVVGGVAVAGLLGYLVIRKGGKLFSTTLNPASDQNAAYSGVNALLHDAGVIDEGATLGTSIYDWLHPVNPDTGQEQNVFSQWWGRIFGGSSEGDTTPPYDYGAGGAPGVPWRADDASSPALPPILTDPNYYQTPDWWAGNPLR